jgi:methionine synthase II (cobalamin-independent)
MNSMTVINENTTIEEIVREYPELIRPLMQYGIKCVMCGEPIWGTLKENAQEKGIKNLSEILVDLNSIIAKAQRKVNFS